VGDWFYTAAQRTVLDGEVYDESGYVVTEGTSFSTPLVAGAAAVLKAARPGLTVAQYRSLLINSSTPISRALILDQGAGLLNLEAAVRSTVAVAPTALSFRTGGVDPNISRTLTLSNVGTAAATYTLDVSPISAIGGTPRPSLSENRVTVEPGRTASVTVRFTGTALTPGAYQGYVTITDAAGAVTRVPYWYAVPDTIADGISFLHITFEGQRGSLLRGGLVIRVTDASGVLLTNVTPRITVGEGGGSVVDVQSIHNRVPGAYSATLRLGPRSGENVFTVEAGDVSIDVVIFGN
jgi:minor extracellular serine protease Vpr